MGVGGRDETGAIGAGATTARSPGVALGEVAQPGPGRAAGLVEAELDVLVLLAADPAALADETPEDAELLEDEVEFFQGGALGGGSGEASAGGESEGVEREAVEALAEGETVGFGQAGRAVEGPADKGFEEGEEGRRRGHGHGRGRKGDV